MKTLITSLLLLTLLVACTSNKKPDTEISETVVAQCNLAAPPPAISHAMYESPVVTDDGIEEESLTGYGSGAGSGDPNIGSPGESDKPIFKTDKKKIIKDGSLSIKTKDIVSAKKNFDAMLKKINAYYETEDFDKSDERMSYSLKIRVPSANFEKLVTEVENGKDEIVSKSINARDVTEEYMDVEARLINKREYLKKYKEILSRAFSVKDILEVEENIRKLQEEIESKEGRLKYLNDQVTYSTLDVSLFKEIAYVYKPQQQDSFKERVKNSLSNGWKAVVDFALWLITIWPQLLIALVVILLGRRWYKKRKTNK